jgi:hypothetical protein
MSQKHMKKWWIWGISLLLLFSICLGCGIYIGDYYHADLAAIATVTTTASETELEGGHLAFVPPTIHGGFIFYPGGKVEHTAYVPLMRALASHGILCILVKMPFRLAVFDMNAADGIQEQFSQVENWYIGGHSLGGAMAASYLEKHHSQYRGLVLLGAYSSVDLSQTDLQVLSVYGTEDGVMDREKYEMHQSHLPKNHMEYEIEGGCHAYFGMYGEQAGDGIPTLTPKEQIKITSDYILSLYLI